TVRARVQWADYVRERWSADEEAPLEASGDGEPPEEEAGSENPEEADETDDGGAADGQRRTRRTAWRRIPRDSGDVELPLDADALAEGVELPDTGGVFLQGLLMPTAVRGLPDGTHARSVFVVNRREPVPESRKQHRDEAFLF